MGIQLSTAVFTAKQSVLITDFHLDITSNGTVTAVPGTSANANFMWNTDILFLIQRLKAGNTSGTLNVNSTNTIGGGTTDNKNTNFSPYNILEEDIYYSNYFSPTSTMSINKTAAQQVVQYGVLPIYRDIKYMDERSPCLLHDGDQLLVQILALPNIGYNSTNTYFTAMLATTFDYTVTNI